MKKILVLLFLILSCMAFSQNEVLKIKLFKNFKSEYKTLYHYSIYDTLKYDTIRPYTERNDTGKYRYVNVAALPLVKILYSMDSINPNKKNVSSDVRKLITYIKDDTTTINKNDGTTTYLLKTKILKEVGVQLNLLMDKDYPYYGYESKNKKLIKFISIRTGNDLFTPTGIISQTYGDKYYVPDNNVFQRNDDRDYTGSFLAEIGTDYLNFLRRRPIKSYQTLLYGFDVYTPFFRDTLVKFKNDTSYNKLDRPHASFQYFGWSKKSISKYDRLIWSTTIKFGKIGGKTGEKFQTGLHQDISYSLRPKGWGAQIANGGRIGFSIETMQSYQWQLNKKCCTNPNSIFKVNFQPFLEQRLGTYMTNATAGISFSNKTFKQNNQNFINHRTKQGVQSHFDHFMWRVAFSTTYVVHNTMLEGYGIIKTSEDKSDSFTPKSKYILDYNQVKRFTYLLNIALSYTTRYATIFYNWKSFSPETNLGNIGINSPSGNEMNISGRWHHFAEIGLTFNIH